MTDDTLARLIGWYRAINNTINQLETLERFALGNCRKHLRASLAYAVLHGREGWLEDPDPDVSFSDDDEDTPTPDQEEAA